MGGGGVVEIGHVGSGIVARLVDLGFKGDRRSVQWCNFRGLWDGRGSKI